MGELGFDWAQGSLHVSKLLNLKVKNMAYLDTHRAIEKIISTGVSKETAEAIVDTVSSKNDDLVTKNDLKLAVSELKSEINVIASNMKWQSALGLLILGLLVKDLFF
jgi:hypothetical protein